MTASLQLNSKNLIEQDGEVYFLPHFIDDSLSQEYFEVLHHDIPWQQRSITMFGKTVDQPRLISWHAERDIFYSYSGIDLTPLPWHRLLLKIKKQIELAINTSFNSAFLNLYRHGHDYMGWHRDNEKTLGPYPLIASVSLGATRKFKFKHMKDTHLGFDIKLNSGSLLLMCGDIQHHWKHCLPRALRVNEPRINITFRQVEIN